MLFSNNTVWACTVEAFKELRARAEGLDSISSEMMSQYQASLMDDDDEGGDGRPTKVNVRGVASLKYSGAFAAESSFMTWLLGLPTYSQMRRDLVALAGDDEVHGIHITLNSPGGQVSGLKDTADLIASVAKIKPVVVHVSGNLASAAFILASQATAITTNSMGMVGSLGVIMVVADTTEAQKERGVVLHAIGSTKLKALGADGTVDEEVKADLKTMVDALHKEAVYLVSNGLGLSATYVNREIATGGMFIASQAKELGMVDEVMSIDESINATINGVFDKSTNTKADGLHAKGYIAMGDKTKAEKAKAEKANTEKVNAGKAQMEFLMQQAEAGDEATPTTPEVEGGVVEGAAEGENTEPEATTETTEANQEPTLASEFLSVSRSLAKAEIENEKLSSEISALKEQNEALRKALEPTAKRLCSALGRSFDAVSSMGAAEFSATVSAYEKEFLASYKQGRQSADVPDQQPTENRITFPQALIKKRRQ